LKGTETLKIWSERWRTPEAWLSLLEESLRKTGARVVRGGNFDRWDLDVSYGTFASIRVTNVVEEHGAGRQLVRFRLNRRCSRWALITTGTLGSLAAFAAADGAWSAAVFLCSGALPVAARTMSDLRAAVSAALSSVRLIRETETFVEEEEQSGPGSLVASVPWRTTLGSPCRPNFPISNP
jgi:hypothetical protein